MRLTLAGTKTTTRDQILDATERIMARYGFRKMTMEDIAKEARVGRRTIYLYFKNKEDVALSSIGRVVESAQTRMKDVLCAEGGDIVEKLRAMLKERVMGRVRAVAEYHESLDEIFEVVRPAYIERRRQYFFTEQDLISQALEIGIEEGKVHMSNPMGTAAILLQATNAYLPYSLSVRELGNPDQIEKQLSQMVDLLINGVTKK
ncbi:MAG: TetR/AcrR family transcriptional regulator, partial [Chlorobia bacterium]|nr:TetR/AcrR family transcriptional regulator [Fimbriimonadaceae bacterium]